MPDPIKFVGEVPEAVRKSPDRSPKPWIVALRAHPGQWAEIARYPKDKAASARVRAWGARQRHPDLESAVRTIDGEAVLFMRAVKA